MSNRRNTFSNPDSKRVTRDRDAKRKAERRAKYAMQGRA